MTLALAKILLRPEGHPNDLPVLRRQCNNGVVILELPINACQWVLGLGANDLQTGSDVCPAVLFDERNTLVPAHADCDTHLVSKRGERQQKNSEDECAHGNAGCRSPPPTCDANRASATDR